MHEYGIVEELVQRITGQISQQGIEEVKELRLRRDSTFSKGALEQAYEMLSPNTPLQNAKLVIEDRVITNECSGCGYQETINAEDLLGHYYVCPKCGQSVLVDEHHGLELLEIKTE